MALTNLSASDKIVLLMRHVNPDVGGQFNAVNNNFQTAFLGVAAYDEFSGGVIGFASNASVLTTKFDFQFDLILTVPDAPTPCSISGQQTNLFQGDGSMLQLFNLEIGPGATKSATVTYKPI
jgi:hypothetical protein